MLKSLVIETGSDPVATIIWLHGLGADGHDFEPIVPELGLPSELPVRFIFPHAPSMPVTLNGGYIMPAWYDIRQSDLGIEHDVEGIAQSDKSIRKLIEQEIMHGRPTTRIMLAGFSQGAAMALHVGLRQTERLGGIIALSGYLLQPETFAAQITDAGLATPIFMAHGIGDDVVPYALGDGACRRLKKAGCEIDWHSYPMAHHVCAEEIGQLGLWIQEILSRS